MDDQLQAAPAAASPATPPVATRPIAEPVATPAPVPIPNQRRIGRPLAIVAAAIVVLLVIAFLSFKPPERINAQSPAPTPAGFQLVSVDEYQYAVPGSWRTDVLDDNAIPLADRVDQGAPGAGDVIRDASGEIEGTQSVAVDTATGDNANVIPYRALDGNPTDADTLAEIEQSFRDGEAGVVPDTVSASPGDVHGFPAAVLRMTANVNGARINLISTIIQTGDRVFQVTVTSPSAPRAETLSSQIVPTFSPH